MPLPALARSSLLLLGALALASCSASSAAPVEPPAEPTCSVAPPVTTAMPAMTTTAAATAGTVAPNEAAPGPAPPPAPLPAGSKVLHVGDSMADALGKDLHLELVARGVKSFLKAKEATYIPEWAGFTMGLSSLLLQHQPDLVIVTLGGNEVAMPDPTVRAEPIRKIAQMIGDRPCVWVGAPLWGPHTGILKVIRDNCAPCRYVDTNELVPNLERLKDGVHPTLPERKRWARAMIDWLASHRDPAGRRPWELLPQEPPRHGADALLATPEAGPPPASAGRGAAPATSP